MGDILSCQNAKKDKIKVALLSCTHGHARGYYWFVGSALFDVVAASVLADYRSRVFLERLDGVDLFDNDEAMLDAHPEIEAVVMASANYMHPSQFKLCFERGIHVLSMKIPTLQLDKYKEILDLQKKYNTKCFIELEMRASSEVLRLKELLESGKIGNVSSFAAWNLSHNPMWWLPWHGIPEESYGMRIPITPESKIFRGGALTDHPHIFDAIQYILSDTIDEVYAESAPNMRNAEVEDFAFIIGRMKNGVSFSLDPSYSRTENPADVIGPGWEQYPKRVEVNMSVFGDRGYILSDVYGNWIHHTGRPNHNYVSARCGGRSEPRVKVSEAFYDYIRGNGCSPITLEEHYKTMCIIDAAYQSMYERKPIKVNYDR
ncbi:MAG: Gfo/Idh/MocA family oxidoreductase [Clostridia bacterium]